MDHLNSTTVKLVLYIFFDTEKMLQVKFLAIYSSLVIFFSGTNLMNPKVNLVAYTLGY